MQGRKMVQLGCCKPILRRLIFRLIPKCRLPPRGLKIINSYWHLIILKHCSKSLDKLGLLAQGRLTTTSSSPPWSTRISMSDLINKLRRCVQRAWEITFYAIYREKSSATLQNCKEAAETTASPETRKKDSRFKIRTWPRSSSLISHCSLLVTTT